MNHNINRNIIQKQYGGNDTLTKQVNEKSTNQDEKKRQLLNSKDANGEKPNNETSSSQKILVPECYTRGRCGPEIGFCDGQRFCNSTGTCGPETTHKPDITHNNYKYRLCKGNDTHCIKTAMCGTDDKNNIKCRLVFANINV